MFDRCYQFSVSLLILLNLLLQSCQVPLNNISTEEVLPDLSRDSAVDRRGTSSPLSPQSLKSADEPASAGLHVSSSQMRMSVSNEPFVMPRSVVRSTTLARGLFSTQVASLSGTQVASSTLHGANAYPALGSNIAQDPDTFSPVPFRSYRTSSGECVAFRRVAGRWQAVVRSNAGICASKCIMPVVSEEDIGETLSWLQAQNPCISRSRIHLVSQFRAPYNLCVYLGKYGLLGGTPEQEKKPKATEKYRHERVEQARLQKEQIVFRGAYEQQLHALKQTEEKYQQACKLIKVECSNLKSDMENLKDFRQQHEATVISLVRERDMYKAQYEELQTAYLHLKSDTEELEDYRQQHETTVTSLTRERDMYKDQYEKLRAEYSNLKSYVTKYQGPERVLFQPHVSGTVFGKEEWARYLGDIDAEPPLPSNIDVILNSTCPFWPSSRLGDTHLLVLIPAAVCGRPFTLDLLEWLTKNPHVGGHSTQFRYESNAVKEEFGGQPSSCNAYWILITKSVVPDSQCKTVEEQELLVADYSRKKGLNYEIPSPLEAATTILSHYVRSGERICPDSPRMYTRCTGKIDDIYPICIGLFSSTSLNIGIDDYNSSSLSGGTLCLWKL
jgi:hypothetical protein